jgi:hypothetical protein
VDVEVLLLDGRGIGAKRSSSSIGLGKDILVGAEVLDVEAVDGVKCEVELVFTEANTSRAEGTEFVFLQDATA